MALHICLIIGKVILCILALLLLLLLAVLFVPVRYRLFAVKEEALKARANVSWLFYGILLSVRYEGDVNYCLKILGIPVYDKKRREKARKKKEEKKALKEAKRKRRAPEKPAPSEKSASSEKPVSSEKPAQNDIPFPQEKPEKKEAEKTGKETGHKSLLEKIKIFFQKLWKKIKKIRYRLQAFCDKIREIRENIEYYRTLYESELFQKALGRCKKQLYHIYKNLRPGVIKIQGVCGFNDPATTGKMMALQGVLYPLLGNRVWIEPDFEREVFMGKALIKGKITVFVFLKALLIMYFDKNIRQVYRLLKKEEAEHVGQ